MDKSSTHKPLVYCTQACPYCHMALRLLETKGVEAERIYVDKLPERRSEMVTRSGKTSVPQIFIGDYHVGGYRELAKLDLEGRLDQLLTPAPAV